MFLAPITAAPDRTYAEWVAKISTYLDRATTCADPVGAAGLAFRVDADGSLSDIRVTHSSGDAKLDSRAVARLRAIGRLPAGPADALPRTQFARVALPAKLGVAVPNDQAWNDRVAVVEAARRRAFA
jgi:TonB family protein